ncbi:MAG: hypothetical protein QXV32_03655 [Conexivisphaerales archaeon]
MSNDSGAIAFYNIHDLVTVKITGSNSPIGQILDSTLQTFRCNQSFSAADLHIVLGRLPSDEWRPSGYTVGDRILFDPDTEYTTVFRNHTWKVTDRQAIEYVIQGDVRASDVSITVYFPNMPGREDRLKSLLHSLVRLHGVRALLAAMGDAAVVEEKIEEEGAKLRLSMLEPFLYYRLPRTNATLVHASAACFKEEGILIAGSGHVGKTTLLLELLKSGFSYLGEDLVIADNSGNILSYPEPIRLQSQHLNLISGSLSSLVDHKDYIRRIFNAYLLKHHPSEFLRHRSRVHINQLFKEANTKDACSLSTLIIIKRTSLSEPRIRLSDSYESGNTLAAELFWEFEAGHWRHNQYLLSPSTAKGEDFLRQEESIRERIIQIMQSFCKNSECFLVELPYAHSVSWVRDWLMRRIAR